MSKIIKLLTSSITLFCVATVVAQAAGVAYLSSAGKFTADKWNQVLAVMYDVDVFAMHDKHRDAAKAKVGEQVSLEEVARARILKSLDLTLREQALEKGLIELRALESTLKEDRRRYDNLKNSFDSALAKLEEDAKGAGIVETQRTLEIMPPKQAKEQLLKMISEGATNDVVAIVKGMAIDKRKKIFAEFKDTAETEKLYDILKQIRKGDPEQSLIKDTRDDIKQFSAGTPSGSGS